MKVINRYALSVALILGVLSQAVAEVSPQAAGTGMGFLDDDMVYDEYFQYSLGSHEGERFKCLKGGASLLDLYLFAELSCYKHHIAPLLKGGKPITEEEAGLLFFVLDVTSATIDAISASLLDDLVFKKNQVMVTEALARDHGRYYTYIKSYLTQSNPDDPIRPLIKRYASHFEAVPQEVKFNVLMNLDLDVKVDSSRLELYLDGNEFPKNDFEKAKLIAKRLAHPIKLLKDLDVNLSNHEKGCMSIKGDKYLGDEWSHLRESTESLLRFYWGVFNDMKSYNAPNGPSAKRIKGISVRTLARREKTKAIYLMALYEIPFVLLTFRASGEYRKNKGVFNDNESGMKFPLLRLNDSIRGTAMLTHVESDYALDVYAKFIKNIKGDMATEDFTTVLTKMGIKAKAKRTNQYDNSTGLPVNSLED